MPKIKRHYYRRAKRMSDSAINITQSIYNSLESTSSSISGNNIPLHKSVNSVQVSNHFSPSQNIYRNNYQLNKDLDNTEQNNNCNNFKQRNILENEPIISNNSDINKEFKNIVNVPASDNLVSNNGFVTWLQKWAIKNRISHVALNELMTGIKSKYPELPSDGRSLLKTPRKINEQDIKPGQYYHFGLTNCVKQLMSRYFVEHLQFIQVNINIDGLPLFKSSNSQVYPILCNLIENYNEVNIVEIYCGNEKPADVNVYLRDFVEEVITLTTTDGITINDHVYPFKINAFICDIPAKSFITFTKGHSGYYSCTKCTAKGKYIHD